MRVLRRPRIGSRSSRLIHCDVISFVNYHFHLSEKNSNKQQEFDSADRSAGRRGAVFFKHWGHVLLLLCSISIGVPGLPLI